jgi:GTP cyclohydrolase IA
MIKVVDTTKEEQLISELLKGLGLDLEDENFKGTPNRVYRHLREFTRPLSKIEETLKEFACAKFPAKNKDMVIVTDIQASSLCPHHLTPILYRIDAGYIPKHYVVGLSKIARIATEVAKYPYLQETYTEVLASALYEGIESQGSIVVVRGLHTCMVARGVKQRATTITSSVTGVFLEEPHAKQEFLELIKTNKRD